MLTALQAVTFVLSSFSVSLYIIQSHGIFLIAILSFLLIVVSTVPPERVPNEWQRHFSGMFFAQLRRLRLPLRRVVRLIDVFDREVLRVERIFEIRLKRCTHLPDTVPVDAPKVRVLLDLRGAGWAANVSDAILGVAEKAECIRREREKRKW